KFIYQFDFLIFFTFLDYIYPSDVTRKSINQILFVCFYANTVHLILFNMSFSYNFIMKSNKSRCARFTCCHLQVLTVNNVFVKRFHNSKANKINAFAKITKECKSFVVNL
ncbi:unnamed protein product, partial [Trichobilharzia szidati]